MKMREYIRLLSEEMQAPLPGLRAQRRLAPRGRIPDDYHPEPPHSRQAAVLIHLVPPGEAEAAGRPSFPVILRPPHDTHHAGQIALPGGEREAGDDFPRGTALREAYEELGISGEEVRTIGVLSPLFIPVSNFSVLPVVSWTEHVPELRPDPSEVAEAFFVSTDALLAPPETGSFPVPGGYRNAPFFSCARGRIWGATAMMLSEFAELHERIHRRLF
jgi:8-oxo-dGTP pyrophosphatase MutT (NUDIX family)